MAGTIYYFTGTGNSLYVARAVAQKLGDCKLVNMAKPDSEQAIEDNSDTVGFVFPVFYGNMPVIVQNYVKKLKLSPEAYVFSIVTVGGEAGASNHELDKLLRANGSHLSAGFSLIMPDNAYIWINLVTPAEKREQVLKAADAELAKIIEALQKKEQVVSKENALKWRALGSLSSTFAEKIYRLPRRYHTTDKCSGCGTCTKLCPVNNVTLADKKVTWGSNCTHCLACFHWCPRQAVEIGGKSADIARYHHPAISVKDIIEK
ncbi:EFR1 family ferrodoxin [Methanocella sp. MCL-LM]|uniref:EFR1 family ferrodoxin n=1 Tax=Methanocella sp. MCL-LM TaxID=3412035 RepID=UPI003C75C7FA